MIVIYKTGLNTYHYLDLTLLEIINQYSVNQTNKTLLPMTVKLIIFKIYTKMNYPKSNPTTIHHAK